MIPLTRPTLPALSSLSKELKEIFATGMMTNGRYVKKFEDACAKFLGVRYVVAVNSGTAALMIALGALPKNGEVLIPSFTFTSSGHSLLWLGLRPVFVDIDPRTFNMDPSDLEKKITANTVAIMPTHVFGNPADHRAIQAVAKKHKLKLIYDAAHAFGATYYGRSVAGLGDINCYSLTPTKVLTSGEGGLITTNNRAWAERFILARNNGDSFDRKAEFLGLSARLNEFAAIIGLGGLKTFRKNLKKRLSLVALYKKNLRSVPGISFQLLTPRSVSAYKDFAIIVDEKVYGHSRDALMNELKKNNIASKVYFDPPLHKKSVYKDYKNISLPRTEWLNNRIMDLPLYSHMAKDDVLKVCAVINNFSRSRS